MSQQLIKSRMGRVILHAVCLLRNPRHAHWHWRGMVREFLPAAQLNRARAQ
jgi:hypothetical protein